MTRRKAPKGPLRKKGDDAFEFRGDLLDALGRQHWEPAELKAFFDAVKGDPFWEPYFMIQYFWGCRVSEPALLAVSDVSVKKKRIVITRLKKNAASEKTPDGVSEDVHDLPAALIPHVKTILAWRKDNNQEGSMWLFPSKVRRGWKPEMVERLSHLRRNPDNLIDAAVSRQSATRWFQKFAEEADIPDTKNLRRTHVLRHTRATLLFAGGANSDYVKRYLGHSFLSTTEKYIHAADELRRRHEEAGTAMIGFDGVLGDD